MVKLFIYNMQSGDRLFSISRDAVYMLTLDARSDLTKKAEKASVAVFATNLKQLLLTPPVRGKYILGIDPGFHNGCKFAVISATGK